MPDTTKRRQPRLPGRLMWFAGLWIASVAAIGAVAYGLRWLIGL